MKRHLGAILLTALAAIAVMLVFPRAASAQLLSPGPLAKAHASIEGDQHCNDCHSSGKRVEQGLCLKCHGDIGSELNAGKGLHGRQYKGKPCEGCHADHLGVNAHLVRWDPAKFNHDEAGWTLNGAHKNTTCAKCHGGRTNSRGAATYLNTPTACNACHKDVHENRFGATCTNCHTENNWKELNLKSFNHDQARFPLRGSHGKVQCAKCHQEPPKYVGLKFQACTDCHKDPHGGKLGPNCVGCHDENAWKPANFSRGGHPGVSLANGHSSVACRTCHDKGNLAPPSKGVECASCHRPVHKAPFGKGCAQCHATITWMGLARSIGLSAHGRTAYPLTGKHETINCASCHKPELPRDTRYRALKFGKCLDCHDDKHRGEFVAGPTGAECATCHSTAGYRPTLFGAVAHQQTKFPLVGKHVSTACSACHETPKPRLDLHVAKKQCAECHANPHGDQFAKEMAQGGCAHCHEPGGWDLPKIDHSTWPLTGAHATAKCESCHKPTPEDRKAGKGGSYRGVPRNCSGCHDDLHAGQFKQSEPVIAECDKCHATNVFKIPKFDHAVAARWPITGGHTKLTCDRCHSLTKLKDGTETIRWRLPNNQCGYCHADPHTKAASR